MMHEKKVHTGQSSDAIILCNALVWLVRLAWINEWHQSVVLDSNHLSKWCWYSLHFNKFLFRLFVSQFYDWTCAHAYFINTSTSTCKPCRIYYSIDRWFFLPIIMLPRARMSSTCQRFAVLLKGCHLIGVTMLFFVVHSQQSLLF